MYLGWGRVLRTRKLVPYKVTQEVCYRKRGDIPQRCGIQRGLYTEKSGGIPEREMCYTEKRGGILKRSVI